MKRKLHWAWLLLIALTLAAWFWTHREIYRNCSFVACVVMNRWTGEVVIRRAERPD